MITQYFNLTDAIILVIAVLVVSFILHVCREEQ